DAVAAHVRTADVVIVEHPYLYPIIERLGIDVPVVVNTHNVEIDLKAAVLAPSTVTEDLLARVRRVEGAAVQGADLVTACSDDDARRLGTSYGRDVESIVVFPNGTDLPDRGVFGAERRRLRRRWFERFRWGWGTPLPRRLAVFVGSWHPPNIDAAEFLLELAVESPDLMICSVGGHGGAFAARDLPDNIMFPGVVSTAAKSALFSAADVAVNPMRVGSGTNLKLVEFFGHGVPVVSTPYGARGFGAEDRVHLLLAEPGHFAEAVDEVLADPDAAEARARAARDLAGSYDWASIGAGYRALVSALIDG
ncbi:MAG: glycosyltransferase family 4 protein, partial [Actinobacteria bacterium]|nr:glycosyltransferase family 4 protein [Actinomycetota bacterium]